MPRTPRFRVKLLAYVLLLGLVAAACSPAVEADATAAFQAALTQAFGTAQAQGATSAPPGVTQEAPTSLPTETPAPSPTPGGCDNAQFIEDVTIPDGTVIQPNADFTKTWRLLNTGTCAWDSAYALVYVDRDLLGTTQSVAIEGRIVAGDTVDVSVPMKAPAAAGAYRTTWRMRNPAGELFGPRIFASIVVPATPTPTPTNTATPTPTATPTITATAALPDLTLASIGVDAGNFLQVTVKNSGSGSAGAFKVRAVVSASTLIDADVASLAPGATTTLTAVSGAFTGNRVGTITLDHASVITETDETNNTFSLYANTIVPGESGSVKQDGTVSATIVAGDSGVTSGDLGRKAYLSWDVTPIAGKTIAYASVDLRPATVSGAPFTVLGPLKMIDDFWNATALTSSLYSTISGTVVMQLNGPDVSGTDLTARVQNSLNLGYPRFQLKFEWTTAINSDSTTDSVTFSSAEALLLVAYK